MKTLQTFNENWKQLCERMLFDAGKLVLGKNAGGMIVKLLRQHGIEGAWRAVMAAASKQNPREYVGAALNTERTVDVQIGERLGNHIWDGGKWAKIEQ